mmetsp:Transcript_134672/g.233979  ORF Transcript_134672/g.233979 Transcript_134672/m.233979 type:complete len:234 (-) Transcript_134672:393-1094(-)
MHRILAPGTKSSPGSCTSQTHQHRNPTRGMKMVHMHRRVGSEVGRKRAMAIQQKIGIRLSRGIQATHQHVTILGRARSGMTHKHGTQRKTPTGRTMIHHSGDGRTQVRRTGTPLDGISSNATSGMTLGSIRRTPGIKFDTLSPQRQQQRAPRTLGRGEAHLRHRRHRRRAVRALRKSVCASLMPQRQIGRRRTKRTRKRRRRKRTRMPSTSGSLRRRPTTARGSNLGLCRHLL